MSERLRLQPLEIAIVTFGLAIFLSSFLTFLSGVSLRQVVLGWQDELDQERVGVLLKGDGGIRRKAATQNEFKTLPVSGDLFNFDTIVTGPEGSATLELFDGSSIDLAPKTMIKLVFESRLSLAGISRATTINVVSGKVKGRRRATPKASAPQIEKIILKPVQRAAAPIKEIIEEASKEEVVEVTLPAPEVIYEAATPIEKIEPPLREEQPVLAKLPDAEAEAAKAAAEQARLAEEAAALEKAQLEAAQKAQAAQLEKDRAAARQAIRIQMSEPKNGVTLRIPDGSKKAELRVPLRWKKEPANLPVRLSIRESSGKEILNQEFNQASSHTLVLNRPGTYEWTLEELLDPSEEGGAPKRQTGSFKIAPDFEGIRIKDPLVSGQKTSSNVYTGKHLKDFDITLLWEPFPDVKEYTVSIFRGKARKQQISEKTTQDARYVINRKKVFSGTIYYDVTGKTKNGFEVRSNESTFRYNFLPPIPSYPRQDSQMTMAEIEKEKNQILFTWVKTNYTDYYEFELSKDSNFDRKTLTKKVTENFTTIENPGPGTYWWRVRSYAKGLISPPTPSFSITIRR